MLSYVLFRLPYHELHPSKRKVIVIAVLNAAVAGLLGTVFLVSAVPKLWSPDRFVFVVLSYRVMPDGLAAAVGGYCPPSSFFLLVSSSRGVSQGLRLSLDQVSYSDLHTARASIWYGAVGSTAGVLAVEFGRQALP